MKDFFRGWRRKVGVVALVLACAVMGLWIRGYSTFDRVVIRTGDSSSAFHFSNTTSGVIGVYICHSRIIDREHPARTEWISLPNEQTAEQVEEQFRRQLESESSAEAKSQGYWVRRFRGFMIGGGDSYWHVDIPYWSVTLPLTLLSAYLLLWKPKRKETPHA